MAKKKKAEVKKKKPTTSKKEPSAKEIFEIQVQELKDQLELLTERLNHLKADDQELRRLCQEEALKKQLCVAHLKRTLLEESRRLASADQRLSELSAQTELTALREAEKRTAVEQNQQLTVSVLRQQCKELEEKLAELGDKRGERKAQQENIRQMKSLIALKNAKIQRLLRDEELATVHELLTSCDSLARDCELVKKGWELHLELEKKQQDLKKENEDLKREYEEVRRRIERSAQSNKRMKRQKRALGLDVEMQELMRKFLSERMSEQEDTLRRSRGVPGGMELEQDREQRESDGSEEEKQEKLPSVAGDSEGKQEKKQAADDSEEEKQDKEQAADDSEEEKQEKEQAADDSEEEEQEKKQTADDSEEEQQEKKQAAEGLQEDQQQLPDTVEDLEMVQTFGKKNDTEETELKSQEQMVDRSEADEDQQQPDSVGKQMPDSSRTFQRATIPEEAGSARKHETLEHDQKAPDGTEKGRFSEQLQDSSDAEENKRRTSSSSLSNELLAGRPGTSKKDKEMFAFPTFERAPHHKSPTPLKWIEMSRNALKDFAREVARIQEDQERYIQSIEREIEKNRNKNGIVASALLRADQIFQERCRKSVDYQPSDVDPEVLNQIKMVMDMCSV